MSDHTQTDLTLHSEKLVKRYRKRTVVNEVSINVKQGEIVGLLGPNGAGKTTTFYMMVGLVTPNSGKIFLNETNITKKPMYKRARMGVGYLAQEASVFRNLTVRENLESVLQFFSVPSNEIKRRVDKLIEEFGLHKVVNSKGYSLSGGERRRTEIARALVTEPKFILLDEPFAGVDPIAVEDIQEIVAQLTKQNIGILITDHNVHETLAITDRAYLMFEGNILMEGTADILAENEDAKKLYLGEQFKLDRYKND
ncbi:MAG TPA: LPS export ABC transporter ATP-binding protein [Balneola sp.]|jgi:lipopolysaccharide export system ATP-binding protein|nr:LPS export ABC transporter ATP-binding protein [Bacteroidota bacterium]MAC05863.1 LPS export ABC transporter ATP-binding protein [Balneola sp.]HAH43354.1 LPS export ABC transporter ATP-binding protein [Planctomycetaceae bacterium]MAO77388.1 LPS export ABC transporter ATP-binding protein [Balneola sp.]MBF65346.1 LPS export ABC transporter ATP-binding protein [Balneola sp.]|tara:strand:+ start:398 stop:1159 length:762 start_codon:yes stop_codon:yes gene_type:complete